MHATYQVTATDNVRFVAIESRSAIDVVVAKIVNHSTILGTHVRYYVSSPNYGVAIPWISSLADARWITERLIAAGMPTPDAITVSQVLQDLGIFYGTHCLYARHTKMTHISTFGFYPVDNRICTHYIRKHNGTIIWKEFCQMLSSYFMTTNLKLWKYLPRTRTQLIPIRDDSTAFGIILINN